VGFLVEHRDDAVDVVGVAAIGQSRVDAVRDVAGSVVVDVLGVDPAETKDKPRSKYK